LQNTVWIYSIRGTVLRVNVDNADVDREAPSGALERFLANRRPGVIPLLIVLLRALCACRWGSGATGEEAGEAGAATRRAPLGPRLTCALYRVVFMQAQTLSNQPEAWVEVDGGLSAGLCKFMRLPPAVFKRACRRRMRWQPADDAHLRQLGE